MKLGRRKLAQISRYKHFKTVGGMDTSDWLATAGIGVSAATLVAVGFGAVWLQHRFENLRLKRDVFQAGCGQR